MAVPLGFGNFSGSLAESVGAPPSPLTDEHPETGAVKAALALLGGYAGLDRRRFRDAE